MDSYVAFPGLGIELPVREEIFSFTLFGTEFSIRWYSVMIALGLLMAVWYGFRRSKDFGLDKDKMTGVILVSAFFAFIGARLYYVIFSDSRAEYFANPITILEVWNGGLAIYGGVIFAFATALWMCKLKKVDTLRMFDIAAPGFFIGQAIGRWGNFFNQEAFGGNTTLPWGMTGSTISSPYNGVSGYDNALPVHPTFLYESLWCLLGLILVHILSKKAYKFRGQLFSFYIMWYGTGRFFIEMLRTDSLYLGTMRVSCLVAALSVIAGAVLYLLFKSREDHSPKDLFAEELALADGENTVDVSTEEEQGETEEVADVKEDETDGSEN